MKLFGYEISFKRLSHRDPSPDTPDPVQTPQRTSIKRQSPSPKRSRRQKALDSYAERLVGDAGLTRDAGGRVSRETNDSWNAFDIYNSMVSAKKKRSDQYTLARTFDIDSVTNLSYEDLSELLGDISPEISKALWDFIVMCNSGYECNVYNEGSDEAINEQGQTEVDAALEILGRYNGTTNTFFDRVFKEIFLRGAFLMELVLDRGGREFIDIATPDVKTLEFKRQVDDVRGQYWTFGQIQEGDFVSLDLPTVRYVPIQPMTDSIEGHSLCASAFFVAIFGMAVLRDTKRVIQNQGYLRLDVEIDFEKLRDTMPTEIQDDPAKVKIWMDRLVTMVDEVYSNLQPEDTYIHGSTVKINRPVGTVSGDSIQAIDAIFKALERMAVRALKSMPLLLGTNQSRTETQANREWEVYSAGIEIIQHPVESAFQSLMELMLQAKGILARVEFRFAKFRGAEALRDEQVEQLKIKNAREAYDCGYISQDEAAMKAVGKATADAPEPRAPIGGGLFGTPSGAPDAAAQQGENRYVSRRDGKRAYDIIFNRQQPNKDEADDAEAFWREYAPEDAKDLIDAETIDTETEQ